MIGLFGCIKAKNNEEYKKLIRKRMNFMIVIALIGILTTIFIPIVKYSLHMNISEYTASFYFGIGMGL